MVVDGGGEALLMLKRNGVDGHKRIMASTAPTPYLHNIPLGVVGRFNRHIVTVIDLLCQPGEPNTSTPGLDPKAIERGLRCCYQENPVAFLDCTLCEWGHNLELPCSKR